MDICQYHPLEAATYSCPQCLKQRCDQCVDERHRRGKEPRCLRCDSELHSLGARNTVEPFWRRLQECFHYPLNRHALGLLFAVALVGSAAIYVPLGFVIFLLLNGAMARYAFSCLTRSADGDFEPPDITESYDGGLELLFKLLVIFMAIGAAIVGSDMLLGTTIAGLVAFILIAGLPAILINFALTEELLVAINPLRMLNLIVAIGLPYGLLLGFIMIMISSVGLLSSLLGHSESFWMVSLQSLISNYYTLVLFHMMGYMIFQYQEQLGYTAREKNHRSLARRSDKERLLARIAIMLKEGEFQEVLRLFDQGLTTLPGDRDLHGRCFEFLLARRDDTNLHSFVPRYLKLLATTGEPKDSLVMFKRLRNVIPDFQLDDAESRHLLARACHLSNNAPLALKLLNGLHRQEPHYPRLVEAYQLLGEILEKQPGREKQAEQCQRLVAQLKQRKEAEPRPDTPFSGPAESREKTGHHAEACPESVG